MPSIALDHYMTIYTQCVLRLHSVESLCRHLLGMTSVQVDGHSDVEYLLRVGG